VLTSAFRTLADRFGDEAYLRTEHYGPS
jgi:hypothetical protein